MVTAVRDSILAGYPRDARAWWAMLMHRSALCACLWLSGMALSSAAELQLYTEESPPLNFSRDGLVTGFSTELIRQLAVLTGDVTRIKLAPWTRGYAKAQAAPNVGIFTMARIAEREKSFQWVGPISLSLNRFYTRKGSGVRVESIAAAQAQQLVLPREWYSYQYLADRGFSNIYTVTSAERMMQMFRNGRGDMLAVSDIALPALLNLAGMTPDQLEPQLVFLQHESYLAFSLATEPAVVSRWQGALDEMKRDGSFARLFQHWFPSRNLPPRLLEVGL